MRKIAALFPTVKFAKFGSLGWVAAIVVSITVLPLLYVLGYGFSLTQEQWLSLWSVRIPELLWNTIVLAVIVAIFSLTMGISTAWIVARKNFVGRKAVVWLLLLPLTIPTYVFAHIYTVMLEEDGWLGSLWIAIFGSNALPPDISNIFGVAFILAIAGFSYIFLLVRSSLNQSTQNLEEAARIQGCGSFEIFYRVNLRLMRPAIAAGLAVVVLHVLSDFGAVSMLRYQTFTLSIYNQMNGRMDYQAAAGLSFILITLSVSFLVVERFFRNKQRYFASSQARKVQRKPATTKELIFIWFWIGSIAFFSFILPASWMVYFSWDSWVAGFVDSQFWKYSFNSLIIAFFSATLALIIAFPIALYNSRKHSIVSQGMLQTASLGFALPGPVLALGVLTFLLAQFPIIYGTIAALFFAMVIRFLPLAVQAQDAALQHLTPSIEEAGRIFGAGPIENLRRVVLPIIRGGMATAWVLVFIDVLKELPATLILRPTGFDTLPVRIWIEASEEMLELAAPAALMLVVGTIPAIWLMRKSEKFE